MAHAQDEHLALDTPLSMDLIEQQLAANDTLTVAVDQKFPDRFNPKIDDYHSLRLKAIRKQIAELRMELEETKVALREEQATSAALREEVKQRDATIAEQRETIAARDATIAEQQQAIADRDARLRRVCELLRPAEPELSFDVDVTFEQAYAGATVEKKMRAASGWKTYLVAVPKGARTGDTVVASGETFRVVVAEHPKMWREDDELYIDVRGMQEVAHPSGRVFAVDDAALPDVLRADDCAWGFNAGDCHLVATDRPALTPARSAVEEAEHFLALLEAFYARCAREMEEAAKAQGAQADAEAREQALAAELQKAKERVEEVTKLLSEAQEAHAPCADRIKELEEQLAAAEAAHAPCAETIKELRERLAAAEAEHAPCADRIKELEEQLAAVPEAAAASPFDAFRVRLEALLGTFLGAWEAAADKLALFEKLSEDVVALFGEFRGAVPAEHVLRQLVDRLNDVLSLHLDQGPGSGPH